MAPAFALGLILGWHLVPAPPGAPVQQVLAPVSSPATSAPTPRPKDRMPVDGALTERDLLRAALQEARASCVVATLTDGDLAPQRAPLFPTTALRRALETKVVRRRAYGELESMESEALWLEGLTQDSDLGDRSWEDVRFLLGTLHWYLENAARDLPGPPLGPPHGTPDRAYDPTRLRAFQGLEFTDLLGLWD